MGDISVAVQQGAVSQGNEACAHRRCSAGVARLVHARQDRRQLFDLAAKHKPGALPPDVAAFAGRTPGIPVLLRTIENKRLTRQDLERLTEYVNSQLGKASR